MGYSQINRKVTIGDKKHFAKLRKKHDLTKTKHKAINKYASYSASKILFSVTFIRLRMYLLFTREFQQEKKRLLNTIALL